MQPLVKPLFFLSLANISKAYLFSLLLDIVMSSPMHARALSGQGVAGGKLDGKTEASPSGLVRLHVSLCIRAVLCRLSDMCRH